MRTSGYFWNRKKIVEISLDTISNLDTMKERYGYYPLRYVGAGWKKELKKDEVEVRRDIMKKLAEMIELKFPQWKCWGYSYESESAGSWGEKRYGIKIKCSANDFCK